MPPPIVPASVRIANYEASLDDERLPKNLEDRKAEMISRFSDYVNDIVPREEATRAIVEAAVEPLYLWPWYQAFFRQAYKDRFHGGPSIIEVTIVVWEQRGLVRSVMEDIVAGPVMTDPP